ncbi:leucine-rich repeat flightless-interacting protein 2-like [Sphaeramia orbicularis]|uniref:leucine-rich repeat flightless-interacting protein 2-like n=1 Tax=Sphaeramia orbicularis TaxID=375764 RepID=UPI00117C1082|nr:leucine-rich repeat flightless-interacting protein 2-like [Sphaeramia orbicularis]
MFFLAPRPSFQLSYHSSSSSSSRKWGQIHQWMADTEKARSTSSSRASSRHRRGLDDDVMSVRSYRSTSSALRDLSSSKSRSSSRKKDILSDGLSTSSALKSSRSTSSVYNDLHGYKKASSSSSRKDLLTGLYHDQRNYTSLTKTKPAPPSTSSYQPRATTSSSASTTGSGLSRSYSVASICDDTGLYGSGYSSRAPSEYSWYSSGASSTRSSPVSSSDDDTVSSGSQERCGRSRRNSACSDFSDISESAADYFSRSNRRGSIVSDLDDLGIPDLDTVSAFTRFT